MRDKIQTTSVVLITHYYLLITGANTIIIGKIIDLVRNFEGGFNKGFILIRDTKENRIVKVEFQNENLMAVDLTGNRIIAQVPTIITLIDNEQKPISCESLRTGLEVTVFALQVPEKLRSEKALSVIGHLSDNQRDYILQELAVLEGCVAEGLGFKDHDIQTKINHEKEPLFIVYPNVEESAFVEGKKLLTKLDATKNNFLYDVQWLGFTLMEDRATRITVENPDANNPKLQHRAFFSNDKAEQELVRKMLLSKTKNLLFLISIGKYYHEGMCLDATVQLFVNLIKSCVALIKEKNNIITSGTQSNEQEKIFAAKFAERLTGQWNITVVVADILQAFNKAATEEQKFKEIDNYRELGRKWIERAEPIFTQLQHAGEGLINVTVKMLDWTTILLQAANYGYEEKYQYLLENYAHQELSSEVAPFRGSVIIKATKYQMRQQKQMGILLPHSKQNSREKDKKESESKYDIKAIHSILFC